MAQDPNAKDKRSVMAVMFSVLKNPFHNIMYLICRPAKCCGMAFESKRPNSKRQCKNQLTHNIFNVSRGATMPHTYCCDVILACYARRKAWSAFRIHTNNGLLSTMDRPQSNVKEILGKIALHPLPYTDSRGTCHKNSAAAHQLADERRDSARQLTALACGDQSSRHPTNSHAFKDLTKHRRLWVGLSNMPTCEIGLIKPQRHSSIIHRLLVDHGAIFYFLGLGISVILQQTNTFVRR